MQKFILYKKGKIPISPYTMKKVDARDPAHWVDYKTAHNIASWTGLGVAMVFAANDPYFFIDVDKCLVNGQWDERSIDIVNRFPGAYVEISESGTGLHIIGRGGPLPENRRIKTKTIELYTELRFCALTGWGAHGNWDTDHHAALQQLVVDYNLLRDESEIETMENWTTGPRPEWSGPTDDEELITLASAGKSKRSAFTGAASFAELFAADPAALARAYPSVSGSGEYDASSADAALAQHLAYWTGGDCERIERIMMRSALVRDKWIKRRDYYLRGTIKKAVSRQKDVLQQRCNDDEKIVDGVQFLGIDEQLEYFKGCVYVQDMHRVFIPDGALLKPEQFAATYGGYDFAMDAINHKVNSNPWKAFIENKAIRHPKVKSTMFRPDLKPGIVFDHQGFRVVNNYIPVKTVRKEGDPKPFLDHLEKLLPNERDRASLLAYMAAILQHKGCKFQWTPLIQGVEGNGKTLFSRCIAEAIGMQHVHTPKIEEVGKNFNSWMSNKIFVYLEDVYLPRGKGDVIEALKPIITNNYIAIEPKGIDQITRYVCANFMLNSNHKDAIIKTQNDRRFGIFFTAQQHKNDLARDGMTGNYFPNLYGWLERGGYAIVANYLETYRIPAELNPSKGWPAPNTSTTSEAIEHSYGVIEQEVIEAVDEGRPGFAGGWISSLAFGRLLDRMGMGSRIHHTKRREILQRLGYDWHPGLRRGRVNNPVNPDGGKPRLFILPTNPAYHLTIVAEIEKAYSDAQAEGGCNDQTKVVQFPCQ